MHKISKLERHLAPTGRILVGVFFILSALIKLFEFPVTVDMINAVGLPLANIFAVLIVTVELICGFMILTGFKGKQAALTLAFFLFIATLLSQHPGQWDNNMQQTLLFQNIAIVGALLFMSAHINRVADAVDNENNTQSKPIPTL